MKIFAMVHGYVPHHNAGAETTLHALLAHMAAQGHDVDVQLSNGPHKPAADYEVDGVTVYKHRGDSDPFRWLGSDTTTRPDVVITHLDNTLRASALCSRARVPLVHLVHNDHEWTRGCVRRGPTQMVIFNSDWMASTYARWWASVSGARQPPHTVINPVVHPETLAGVTPGTRFTLINLTEAKGGELFYRLVDELPRRKFLGVMGGYGEQMMPAGNRENLRLLENIPPEEMAGQVYAETKVLLMPSDYETWGRTAIEAAYCGIPTIAHPTPGLLESLGSAGTFIDREDIEGWKAAISRLSTPKGFAKASAAARARAQELDPEGSLRLFANVMQGVVDRGFATVVG